jgi:hypothetical protein
MPNIQQCKQWIDEMRSFLGKGSTDKKLLVARNEEIVKMLAVLKKKAEDKEVPAKVYNDLYKKYQDYAIDADNINKGASGHNAKKDALELSTRLRFLKKEIRLAVAKSDPLKDHKAKEELLREAQEKPFYVEKRERVTYVMGVIARQPGNKKRVAMFQKMLDDAEACEPDYKLALRKITIPGDVENENMPLVRHMEEAKEVAKNFENTAGDDEFRKNLAEARKVVADYEKVCGVSDARGVDLANQQITKTVKMVDEEPPKLKEAKESLQNIISDLSIKTKEESNRQGKIDKLAPDVLEDVKKLLDYAPPADVADLVNEYERLRSLWENQQTEGTEQDWADLAKDAKKEAEKYEEYYNEWKEAEKKIIAKEGILKEAAKISALTTVANYLSTTINRTIRSELLPARKYPDVLALCDYGGIPDQLDELEKNLKNPSKAQFSSAELTARVEVDKGAAELQKEHEKVANKLKELKLQDGDPRPFQKAANDIVEVYRNGARDAFDKKNLATFLQARKTDMSQVVVDIQAVLDTPKELEKSRTDNKKYENKDKFEKARKTAQQALNNLDGYDLPDDHKWMKQSPSLGGMHSDYKEIVKAAAGGDFQIGRLEKIESDCNNKASLIEQDLKTIRGRVAEKEKRFQKSLEQAEKDNKPYKRFYDALREEAEDCVARSGSSLFAMVEEAENEMNDLLASKLPPPADYEKVKKALKDIETLIDGDDMKDYRPEARKVYEKQLKDLKKSIYHDSPAEALKTLTTFEERVQKDVDRAGELKTLRENLTRDLEEVRNDKDFKKLQKDAPVLYKQLLARLNRIGNISTLHRSANIDKGAVNNANVELATVKVLINNAKSKPATRDGMERKAKLDEFEAERQEKAYLGAHQVFLRGVGNDADNEYAIMPEKEVNKDAYKAMKAAVQEAETFAKAGDHRAANEALLKATSLANYFIDNPTDRITSSRKELERLNKEYKSAVSAYLKQVAGLKAELLKVKEDGVDTKKAASRLEPLFALFNAGIFDDSVDELKTPAEDEDELQEQRSTKESALADVRNYQKIIASHKILAHVVGNPIKPVSVARITTTLRGFTGALLAS